MKTFLILFIALPVMAFSQAERPGYAARKIQQAMAKVVKSRPEADRVQYGEGLHLSKNMLTAAVRKFYAQYLVGTHQDQGDTLHVATCYQPAYSQLRGIIWKEPGQFLAFQPHQNGLLFSSYNRDNLPGDWRLVIDSAKISYERSMWGNPAPASRDRQHGEFCLYIEGVRSLDLLYAKGSAFYMP